MARTRQPQAPVRVSQKWLHRGMVASFNPAVGFGDLARNNNASGFVGNITNSVGVGGRAWEGAYQASNNYVSVPRTPDLGYTSGVTFEALVTVNAFQTVAFPYITGIIAQYHSGTNRGPILRFNHNAALESAATPCFIVLDSGGSEYSVVGAAQNTGQLLHLIGLYNGANVVLWVNGNKTLGSALTGSMRNDAGTNISLLSDYTEDAFYYNHNRCLNGKLYLANIYNRGLTDAEAVERFERPWGHLQDQRSLWIQLGAASGTGATTYTVTGSGTVVFSGTPAYKRLVQTITSGGITYTGAGAAKDIHSPDTSGGISYTGTAVAKKLFAPLSSGGITFAGDAVEKLIRSALAAGGLLFGGTAGFIPVLSGGTIYTVTPSGGIIFGSSAAVKAIHDSLSQGGLAYSGIAGYNLIREILAAGGLTFAGVAGVTGPSTGTGSLDQATIDAIALAVWQRVVDAGLTAEQLLRLLVSHAAGSATGLENGAPVFKSLDGTKDRITGTYAAGTRTVTGRDAT